MIRDALSNLGGVGIYGVISIALFFAAFLGVLFWAGRLKRPWLDTMAQLPLEPDDAEARECDSKSEPRHRHE